MRDLQHLHGVHPRILAHDVHPGYTSTRWAKQQPDKMLRAVWHHHAHASAWWLEHPNQAHALVFSWDGFGLGTDGTMWGGEALLGHPGAWQQVASFRPLRLVGGERAGLEPWRSALALCWDADMPWSHVPETDALLRHAWERGVNIVQTSSAGRLFDAAAALTGLVSTVSFEGQGPMWLEAAARRHAKIPHAASLPLKQDVAGIWRADSRLLPTVLLNAERGVCERAAWMHETMAQTLLEMAKTVRRTSAVKTVGFSGGVFQNRLLCERARALLDAAGFEVLLAAQIPVNDAGLALGQLVEAAALSHQGSIIGGIAP
jgi:hydrogenase maturation protein HypF